MTDRKNNRTNYRGSTRTRPNAKAPSRSSNGRNGHRGKSYGKRKRRYDYVKITKLIALLVLIILLVVFGVKGCKSLFAGKDAVTEVDLGETIAEDIKVNGTSIKGLSKEEAQSAVLEAMGWSMTVTYEGDTYELNNVFEQAVAEILEELYAGNYDEQHSEYQLMVEDTEESVSAEIAEIATRWDVPARNAGISAYDEATDRFTFSKEESGVVIDREQLTADIKAALSQQNYTAAIAANGVVSIPELTEEEARAQYKTIGTFTTTTTNNSARNKNISLASAALNGQIVEPGAIFSINEATGERTTEKGYRPAGAYVNGVLVEEPGGGVCQVSSTLYNAVILAGLNTTERFAHSYEPSYVTPGEDAMISYPGLDMKFENNTIDSIGIRASLNGTTLTISIYGIPVLESGVTVSMYTELTEKLPLPDAEREEDPNIPFGEEVVAKSGKQGAKYVTYLITKKDGVEVSREFLHNSTYRGTAPVIKVNTDPNAAIETEADDETEGESPNQSEEVVTSEGASEEISTTKAPETTTAPTTITQAPPTTEAETTKEPETTVGLNPGAASTEELSAGPGV